MGQPEETEDVPTDDAEEDEDADGGNYFLGVAIAVSAGASAGLTYVSAKRCEECPKSLLMISAGICSILIALVCPLIEIPNRIFTGKSWIAYPSRSVAFMPSPTSPFQSRARSTRVIGS